MVQTETYGGEDEAINATFQFVTQQNVDVVIGPRTTCLHEGRVTSIYNVPQISHVSRKSVT